MIPQILHARLKPALSRKHSRRIWAGAALGLMTAAVIAVWVERQRLGYPGPEKAGTPDEWFAWFGQFRKVWLPAGLVLGALGALAGWMWKPNARRLARDVEEEFPELEGRLTTALQQTPGEDGNYTFLQDHLFTETIRHSTEKDWARTVSPASRTWMQVLAGAALVLFLFAWWRLPDYQSPPGGEHAVLFEDGVLVTPGDTELEMGTSLVMLARFSEPVPAEAELVIGDSPESERRLPLTRSLSDPVFGGSVAEVNEPFTYKVAWNGRTSMSYKVRVFEHPKLERSDITLTYPDYTKQAPKRIEDTRHTSAVEGTKIDLELVLNKPVASAVLEPRKTKDSAGASEPLKLEVSPDKSSAVLRAHVPSQSGRYELVLTDSDGRRSKQSVPFSFDVVPNRLPEMKLASPKGDQKPSALQEITFDGTVWDDFGVVACGLEVATPEGETVTVEFGKDVPAKEKRAFNHLLRMEELKAVPDQLFAWHTWADDIGPDGKVRRTKGDLYFAEIRAFEQIFRQGEGMESQQQQQQQQDEQQQQGQGGQAEELVKLQKQIISATWKLAQKNAADKPAKTSEAYPADVKVIRDSQEEARNQATEAAGNAGTQPVTAALWQAALQQMQKALESLEKAGEAPPELATALVPEQAAYQSLLKLQAREYQVSRQNRQQQQRQQQQGQSQGEQQQQQQLDQLDLAKNEDRYETQREAQAQQSAERREQMQVLNRLKELAQRQQDVNEKLKELQTALNEAKTREEKEAAKRELKRLEDEQRQMLADADELRQRMEQQQNQSETAEQRQQLEEARENMRQAAEAAAQGQAGQALANGTRAGEQMEQMREELRKQSAGAFEEELRQMRADAREIARKQEEIAKEMKTDEAAGQEQAGQPEKAPSLGSAPDEEKLAEDLRKQEERTGDLVQRARELSEQAEPSEPLLSRQIYEAARQFSQNDAGAVKEAQQELIRDRRFSPDMLDEMRELQERERAGRALRLTAELQRQNLNRQATRTGERAREGLNQLREGIEQAAESVLGDDTAALRLAEQQLQEAAEAMQREMEQQSGRQPGGQNRQANTAGGQRVPQPREGGQPDSPERQAEQQNQPGDGQPRREGQAGNNDRQPGRQQGGRQPQNGEQPPEGREPGGQSPEELAQNQPQPRESQPPQEGQGNGPQPGPRQGSGRQRSGEQSPNKGQPGEETPEKPVAQNQPQEGQLPGEQQAQDGPDGQGGGQPNQAGQNREGQRETAEAGRGQRERSTDNDGGGRSGGPVEDFETARGPRASRPAAPRDPLTGDGFTNWSDRLREAEELVDETDLRNGIAQARERARQMRLDMKKAEKKPDWAVVELEIVKPLVEVRDRLRQELARRESDKALVPLDRDPVPAQFTDNVKRYYEQLGKE